ncbi:MAG TPA: transglycosylase SLT domain-containing protein [Polyangiaceae bacterium]|nr:transglycosylase SLT domain-containing protein [Polyangiaceae bacterium]
MDRGQLRQAPRLSSARRWLFPLALSGMAGLLVYCSAAPRGPDVKGPPFAPAAASSPAAPFASTAAPARPPDPISLETLTPLLALPGYEGAIAAIEAGEPRRALQALDDARVKNPPPAALNAPFAFVRARLLEQAADHAAALQDFDYAARTAWPLAADAKLGAARALLATRRPADALARIATVDGSAALRREKLLLTANAALSQGDRPAGLSALRAYLDSVLTTAERAAAGLRLANELLTPTSGAVSSAEALEALRVSRRIVREAGNDAALERKGGELAARAIGLLPDAERSSHAKEPPEDALERLRAMVEARRHEDAEKAADELIAALGSKARFERIGCEAQQLRAKAIAGQREWGRAVDTLGDVVRNCEAEPELHARSLFLLGRYASSDKRHAQATKAYGELEAKYPDHTLADDARLYAALSYLELGAEARFTELLQSMPEQYANGDMVAEGVFRLALRRMDKSDWSGAARLLERAVRVLKNDAARGPELAGRERYFYARAELVAGRREQALGLLEEVVQSFPLSYYMLSAYTRLRELAPERAERCLADTLAKAESESFAIAGRPEFSSPGFVRVLELLRASETAAAVRELDELGLSGSDTAPELLWGVSMAYARAGAYRLSHDLPRRRLTDWLAHWPAGPWQKAWELGFPQPWSELVEKEAKKNDVEPALVFGIMREESAFDPQAVSIANAYGLMQLIVPTAKHVARGTGLPYDREALKRPAVNIALGARAMAQLRRRFSDNPLVGIAGYNAGPGNAAKWLAERPSADFDLWVELIPFLETRRYIKRVLASRATYAFIYSGVPEAGTLTLPLKVKPPAK